MLDTFPPMDGSRRPPFEDSERCDWIADYSITQVGFVPARARIAYETAYALASKHGVGFYNVSGNPGEVWFPVAGGGLDVMHSATR
jgi:hypothetical protein